MRTSPRPVVLFAFANDREDPDHYLRNLPEEQRRVREALTAAERSGLCEIVQRSNATAAEVLDVFLDARYRDRVAIFPSAAMREAASCCSSLRKERHGPSMPRASPGSWASSGGWRWSS